MASSAAPRTAPPASGPRLVPILLLGRSGKVMVPGADGPVLATTPEDRPIDLFDFTDYLADKFHRLYVVDLQGVEHGVAQLDYLQELTKDTDVWIDAGVDTADGVIDVLVTGARRAVVSTGRLGGIADLKRAWKLTQEIALEIEIGSDGEVRGGSRWGADPAAIAAAAREIGIAEIVLSPRDRAVDWALVRTLSGAGPVWVDGSFEPGDRGRLEEVHAAGGLFHIAGEIPNFLARGPSG
ncbi:MAG TPA: HisA/HisF-related TIM barrel protein [Thermoplasmata archaeon]|nr:HisA/HisF-related TIM barrel protein [Thermoplasmata archaeon]